jgi:hypothetical protein
VRITGVPAGSSFRNAGGEAIGTDLGGGVWSFTAAQLTDQRFSPTAQLSGTINMVLEAVSRETSNSDLSTTASLPFSVTLLAVPDQPVVTVGTSTGDEDTTIVFGDDITYTQPDNADGSERITEVVISGVDPLWTIGFTLTGGASVDTSVAGVYRITGPNEAAIRNTLNSFAITPPTDTDIDTSVQVTVTSQDIGGGTATSAPSTHIIAVTAVADAPTVNVGAGSFSTLEDTRVALAGFAVGISDTDQAAGRPISESISLVRITGVSTQAGTGFQNAAGTAVGTNLGGGVWTFTPEQLADLHYVPGTNRSGTYNMVLEATARESSNLDTEVFSRPFSVTVTGVPDQVVVSPTANYNLNEDTQNNNMGANFGVTLSDNDGSQTLTVVISGLPTGTGSVTTYTPTGVTHSLVGGVLTLSGASNAVLTALGTVDLRAPTHSDVDWPVTVTATTSENGTTLADVSGAMNIRVRAIADAPTVSGSASTSEDVTVVVPVTASLVDTDGSETITRAEIRLAAGSPAGTVLTVSNASGATVALAGGVYTVTGTEAQIAATLASGVTVTPASHRGENITVQVRAQSTEAATGAQVASTGQRTAFSGWANVVVTVADVADQPSVTVPASVSIEEDTTVALTGLALTKVDADGSEVFTLTLAGVPDGASFGGRGTASAPSGGLRTWTFTEAEIAGLSFTPPLHVHGSWSITATTSARELENSNTAVSAPQVFTITVDAQADQPTIAATGATGDEDSAIAFGATLASPASGIALVDQDGSERITEITVGGFPVGVTPTYSLVGTGSVMLAGGIYTITGANEADIRATLATFAMTPPLHSDANIALNVTATTTDADGSTAARAATHTVIVRAIADQPDLTTGPAAGAEDTNIPLSITADRIDTDGSEVLSVRITLPDPVAAGTIAGDTSGGGSIVNQGGGVFLITAPSEAQLDAILATITFRGPANWSGTANLTVEAITTETGTEILTATAIRSSTIAVTVGAIVDTPAIKVLPSIGGASGFEDQPTRLSIAVTIPDADGSESYVVRLSNLPAGAAFTNAAGAGLGVEVSPGVWEFTPAQLAVLHVRSALNSSADFTLNVDAVITDIGPTGPSTTTVSGTLPVNIIGVADAPTVAAATVVSAEDQPIPLGANITAALVDTDGSETLYYVIAGLPAGVVPSRGTFIGGEWQVSAADMPFLTVAPPAHFSGDYIASIAPGLQVRAITQENDGDQAVANVPLTITITPVVDAFSWSPSVTLPEESSIPLSAAAFGGPLTDNDGSERVVSYTLDLNNVVANARIGGIVADTADFIANHITGPFTNNGDGTITVTAANMAAVSFRNTAFLHSNVDFSIPITARVEEADGASATVSSSFSVTLTGVADVPTVFATSVSGTAGTLIALNPTGVEFGGVSTDTDVALGRTQSERIYYIVNGMNTTPGVELAFTNAAGQIVGLDNGDGSWLLDPADLLGLQILSRAGGSGTVNLTLTSVAVENDSGSRAQSTTPASFSVTVTPGSGGTGPIPLAPVVTINTSSANEDGVITFDVNAVPDPSDTSNPTVAVMFSNIPAGFTIQGATFNPQTGRWIATAAEVNAGTVRLVPPANWSGDLNGAATVQIEAVATNSFLNRATTGLLSAPISVTPVADGPAISGSPAAGVEDTPILLNLSVTPRDAEASSPETLLTPIRITVPAGTSLSAGSNVGGNVWEVTPAQLAGLALVPPGHYHGPLSVTVEATTRDVNGTTATGSATINLSVVARADQPTATAANVTGVEDMPIAMSGLSAALVDADGSEVLSIKITGVPEGAIFSAGGNNGDGSWTIPVTALATLQLTPPPQYSGVMNLTLNAYSLELSNGDTNVRAIPFTVTVTPVADTVALDPQSIAVNEDTPVVMPLQLRMADRAGAGAGENPPEQVEITFTGLPSGSVLASAGALLQNLGGGSWRFTGTEAQANAITFVAPAHYSGASTVTIFAVAIDAGQRGAATVDTFGIVVAPLADAPVLQTNPITGGTGVPLSVNLLAYAVDRDGSETLSVTVSNVPSGATFSAGADQGGGVWRFTEAQLADLTLTLPVSAMNTTLTVTATTTEAATGATATASGSIAVTVGSGPVSLQGTAFSETLTGGSGSDTITAGGGADTLIGGTGADFLTGGTGADVFRYLADHAGSADQITDFSATAGGDVLDIEALLPGYDGNPLLLANFVNLQQSGGDTHIRIDATGSGTFSGTLVTLSGVTGLDLETLRTQGNLLA